MTGVRKCLKSPHLIGQLELFNPFDILRLSLNYIDSAVFHKRSLVVLLISLLGTILSSSSRQRLIIASAQVASGRLL